MNKNHYRIIFSEARSMFIAVAEIVKSKTKAAGQTTATGDSDSEQTASLILSIYKKLNPLNFAVVSLLGAVVYTLPLSSMANTQIIADKSAPSSQQATVLNSSNGLTQVNIQTPSAGGVSRNTYTQFDVGQEGAILNNSRNNVQTQLGGWVQGNPWLGKGEAKVILNEVNSSNPSQLKGYLEVAGKSAQVVIANPSGLVCDGCGVINADRFSLAAGQAVVNQGYLESFRVRDGQVTIEGKGLNGSLTPYTDIYARALNVNAGLYANELTTVLGQNDIDVKDQTAPKANAVNGQSSVQTAKPDFALDVAQLGGMYAGKIFLVGTEAGLGVRNAGSINATENQLTLNANGDLVNTGNIVANKDQIAIQAHNVVNSGNISSTKSKIQVDAADIQNSGLIATSDELKLNAQVKINNDTGVMNAGRIDLSAQNLSNAKGQIQQTGQQELNLTAKTLDNRQGVIGQATKDNTSGNQTGTTAPPVTNPEQNSSAQDSSSITVAEPIDLTPKTFDAGQIQIAQGIHNVSGQILNNADIGLSIQDSIINNGGAIQLPELQFNGQSFENQDGQLIAQVVNITAHNVDNQKGSVIAGESFDLNAVQVNNTLGRLQSSKNLSLKTAGLENSQGQIVAGQQLNIDASQLNNSKGIIASAESDAVLNADHLNNAEGEILAQNLQLTAQQLLNQQGNIYAAQNAQIEAADADNSNGQIAAEQALKINTQLNALNNQNGKMIANAVELNTGLLNNQAGLIQGKQSVKIDTNNNALINKDSSSTSGILSQGILDLAHVSQLDNSKGYMASVGSAQISVQNLNNKAGQISSQTDLNIQQQTAGGRIDNTAGQIQAQQNVHLNADTINNSGAGSHIAAGEKLTAAANQVLNAQTKDATVIGGFDAKNIEITAAELDNQSGVIRATDQAHLNLSEQLNNQLGTLSSLNALNIGTSNKTLSVNNAGGELLAKNQLNLKANELMNQGEIISEGNIDIDLKQSYTHTQDDQILANGTLKLNTENNLVNQSELSAGQKLELSAKNIRNETGASLSANDTHLTAQDTVHNQGLVNGELTHIQANKVWNDGARIYGSHVAIQAHTLDNKSNAAGIGAVIASRGDMDLGVKTLNNQSGGAVKEKAQDNAWIFSAGDLNIGGSLDLNLKAQGSADKIYNGSARIESLGDMYLGAKEIQNTNENLVIELIEKSREKITEYEKNGQRWDSKIIKLTDSGDADDAVLWVPAVEGGAATKEIGEDWTRYIYTNIHSEEEVQTTSPAQIIAGGNLGFDADTSFNNKDSQVLVGLAITSGLDKINNNNTDLHRVDAVAPGGYSRSHTVGWNSKGTEHRNKWGKPVSYQPAPVAAVLPVKLGEVKEYTQSQGNIDPTEQLNTQTVQRNIDAANTVVTGPLTSQQPESQDVSIRTVAQDHLTLPSNALYITAKDSQAQYIVETDPVFANYKKWLSSDYMLDALGLDPAMQQKRIGDGFYEQRLVQDQVAQLTGFRFLEGYGSDEEQYKALMNNGLSFAKQYGLRVGVALSEAQVAQLTSDIVWLEEKTVKLADGSTAKTLVPQVYVKAREGDLKPDGTLISANSINLKVQGNVFNSGTIAGRQAVVLNADNVELLNGRIQANQVGITTQKDVNIVGGQIQAEKTADLNVGGNFNLSSSIQNSQNIVGESAFTYTGIDRVAGIYTKTPLNQVSTDTENLTQTITIRVGGDAKLVGSEIQNANGQTSIQSQGDLTIGAIQTGINNKGYANKDNFNYEKKQEDIGSVLQSAGDTRLQAENIKVKGSQISSEQGSTILSAQQDIDISEGRKLSDTEQAFKVKEKGILSTKLSQSHVRNMSDEAIVSTLDGKNVILDANNLDIRGSNVVSDELTQIQAKENVSVTGAQNQYLNYSESSVKKSGLMSSDGIGFSVGKKSELTEQQNTQKTNTGSMVGSLNGNTNIIVGKNYQQTGSTVSSQNGDVNILAQQVNIEAAKEQSTSDYKHEMEQKGLTLAVNVPVITAVQSVAEAAKQVGQSKNDRVNAMAAANAGFDTYKAGQSIGKLKDALTGTAALNQSLEVGVSLTYGEQKSKETRHTESNTASQSQVYAAGKTNIVATGAGKDSNINLIGSDVVGLQGTYLAADNDVNIKAAEQEVIEESNNKSSGWNAGVTISNQTGLGVTAGGNLGKGKGNGADTSYVNSHVGSKDSLTTISSRNATNIIGGQIQGKGIQVDANELNIESLQDKATYKSKQQDISGQISVGTNGGNVSGSFSKSNVDANYASVNEQSGIFAGDDGYQINVKNNTDLKGAIITSTQQAEVLKKNSLDTGTLTYSNIQNESEYDAKGISLSAGFNAGRTDSTGQKQPNTVPSSASEIDQHASSITGVSKSIGFGLDSDKDSSVTRSGVNTSNITIRETIRQEELTGKTAEQIKSEILTDVTTDTARENSGALKNNFDKEKVQSEINLQMDVTKQFDANRQEAKAEINKKIDEAKKENQSILDKEKNGQFLTSQEKNQLNTYNEKVDNYQKLGVLLDTISTGLSAPTSSGLGIVAATLSPAASYEIGQYFKSNDAEGSTAHILAHTLLGAAVAAAGGNDALTAGLAAGGAEASAPLLSSYLYGKEAKDLTADEKSTISSITGLVASGVGTSTGDIGSTVQSGQSAQNAVENNTTFMDMAFAAKDGKTLAQQAEDFVNAQNKRYKQQNCSGMTATACSAQMYKERQEFLKGGGNLTLDFIPIIGDIKGFHEAKDFGDYFFASVGLIPIVGDAAKSYHKAQKAYDVAKKAEDLAGMKAAMNDAVQACTGGACFTAGTLIETSDGFKAVEKFEGGELVWARNDATLEYGYRPVIATKVTAEQAIFEVVIQNKTGQTETLETTAEHPFWIKNFGWLKASLLESGMTLLDRNNEELTIVSQVLIPNKVETVYNIEVGGFHTYHVGELGTWVHNANCCEIKQNIQKIEKDYGYAGVHSLNRHGAGTTLEQQKYRAKTGIPPDQPNKLANIKEPKNLPDATRFLSNEDLEYALQQAIKSPDKEKGIVEIDFGRKIGEGYYSGGKIYAESSKAVVIFDKKTGKLVSAYPVLPAKSHK